MVALVPSGSFRWSDRFIELYQVVAIAAAAAPGINSSDRLTARLSYSCAPLAAHPRLALQASRRGPVAQGIEQQPSKLKVAGSNPAGVATTPVGDQIGH